MNLNFIFIRIQTGIINSILIDKKHNDYNMHLKLKTEGKVWAKIVSGN